MNMMTNNTIEMVKSVISENRDLYFPLFDDPLFILNTEDREKRRIARALAILMSYERNHNGKILIIGNGNVPEIEEDLSGIRDYLKGRGFDPDIISSNIEVADISGIAAFREHTKDKEYSLVILENAEKFEDEDPGNSEKLKALSSLRADRALITAEEDYDPGYEDQEEKVPGQCGRGKYKGCGGDIFYNPAYSDYKGILNAVMDALGLKPDDVFRKTLKDDDISIYMTGNHLFLIGQNGNHSQLLDGLSNTYGEAFESYANGSGITDRKELFIDFLTTMQRFPLIREGRYLLNNYNVYNGLSITSRNRFLELADVVCFSDEDKKRIIANYDKYAA